MDISNTNVFSKTGSSSNSCAEMAVSQCNKKHRKYVVLHGLSYTCSSQTARHNFLPSNCLPSSTDTELMSEWLSTSPCYSMPWIRLPKLQCQAKHLQAHFLCIKWHQKGKTKLRCSHNYFVYRRESFSNSVRSSGRKSLLPSGHALTLRAGAVSSTTATKLVTSQTVSSTALPATSHFRSSLPGWFRGCTALWRFNRGYMDLSAAEQCLLALNLQLWLWNWEWRKTSALLCSLNFS